MKEKADSKLIKTLNERRLLNLIRENGPITRNELAHTTRMSKVAVSDIINRLMEDGFVKEIGKGQSTKRGGKRPTLLTLNPENGYVIGIEIERRYTSIALANLSSEIIEQQVVRYKVGASLEAVLPHYFNVIDIMLESHKIAKKQLVGIGIGIPGFIDYERGELIFAVTLRGWTNLPLSSRFGDRYNVPIIIENDVRTITLCESLIGAGKGYPNLACVWIGDGIGAGLMVDGQIVRGSTGNAGEIGFLELGHYVANIDRMKNLFNNQRYFGEILSEVNLYDTLRMKLELDSPSSDDNTLDEQLLEEMLLLGDKGDQRVQEILNEYAYPLSIICTHLIKTLNPGRIILNGRVVAHSRYLFKKVHQLVKQSMINIPFESSTIVLGELQERAGIKGAITLALRTIFDPPVTRSKNILSSFTPIHSN